MIYAINRRLCGPKTSLIISISTLKAFNHRGKEALPYTEEYSVQYYKCLCIKFLFSVSGNRNALWFIFHLSLRKKTASKEAVFLG
jgi:hypothetical protein